MHVRDLIISPENLKSYSPAAHSGTTNFRLIEKGNVGAKNMEVIVGTVTPGGGAEPHVHSVSEQAIYLLEGRAAVEIFGETAEMGPGEIVFFPAGVPHKIEAIGPMKALVMYAPPLGGSPAAFEKA